MSLLSEVDSVDDAFLFASVATFHTFIGKQYMVRHCTDIDQKLWAMHDSRQHGFADQQDQLSHECPGTP